MEQPTSPTITVGTVLADTYEITGLIGRGGMGAVWAARHRRLPGKRVAVKVLLNAAKGDREAFARFRREAEIASSIGHPNIVEVLDFNVLPDGTPYQVLELLEGEDLAERLLRGPLAAPEALATARQIGSALAAAHRAQVVHRDLKPGNVFLCPMELGGTLLTRVKVLDFGISKIRGSQTVQTQDSILLGTPQYMSPEQASGKNQELDQRTDVFALGAIVYEMLAGRPPFVGENLVAVIYKVVYEAPPPLAGLAPATPPGVLAAIERALEKDPARRWPDVAGFIAELTGQPLATLDRKARPELTAAALAATGQAPLEGGRGAAIDARAETLPAPPTTHGRGELIPDPPTTAGRLRSALLAAAVVGTLGVSVAIWRVLAGAPRAVAMTAPDLGARYILPLPDLAHPVDLGPRDLGGPKDLAPDLTPPSAQPAVKHAPHVAEALPPEVVAELDEAERAVAANPTEAIRLARHSLTRKQSSRAFSIIARAFCHRGDLGNAKAALLSVGGGDRGRVLRACRDLGVSLD